MATRRTTTIDNPINIITEGDTTMTDTVTSTLEWKAPPPAKRARNPERWDEVAKELRAHPGEWALIAADTHGTIATAIRKGQYVAFRPAGSFEAVTRACGNKRFDVYARYVG